MQVSDGTHNDHEEGDSGDMTFPDDEQDGTSTLLVSSYFSLVRDIDGGDRHLAVLPGVP